LLTDSALLTLRLKTINYSVSNGKGTVDSCVTDEIANLSRISLASGVAEASSFDFGTID
jgi:hypothetical protein